jgi:hypothetical protein
MKDNTDNWAKLTRTARQASPQSAGEPPFGFATRVAARWASGEVVASAAPWERFASRSLAIAVVLMAVSVSVNIDLLASGWLNELAPADPVFGDFLLAP